MRSFFGFGGSGKLFINKNTNRIAVRKADNIKQLAGMNVGAWGDPHLYIRQSQSLNPNNYTVGKFLAKWGDNKPGSQDKELLLLSIETVTKIKLQVYYTNQNYAPNGAKTIKNIRIVYNNVSTTYTNTAYVTVGPITISIIKVGTGANAYLNFEMKWGLIRNIVNLGGALTVILKKIADSGGYWGGGDGATYDGFGVAGQAYGLTRASFETANLSIQSLNNDFHMLTDATLSDTNLSDIIALELPESNILDDLHDQDTNQTVSQWDSTVLGDVGAGVSGSLPIFQDYGTVDHYLANLVNNGASIDGLSTQAASNIITNFSNNNTSSYSYAF